MAGKMMDYLSSGYADYVWLLSINPQDEMVELGTKKQHVHEFDDGGIRIVSMSTDSYFDIQINFSVLSVTDANTIIDLWHDVNKANGMERTFYWEHPIEGDYYVARFMSIVQRRRSHQLYLYSSIANIRLRIEHYALSGVS